MIQKSSRELKRESRRKDTGLRVAGGGFGVLSIFGAKEVVAKGDVDLGKTRKERKSGSQEGSREKEGAEGVRSRA